MEQCKVCRKPSVNSCAACHRVFYCSAEHQKVHWKQHKSKCSPFIIKKDEKMGRYAVAARTLKAGSLVLEEIPVLSAPINPKGADRSTPICLSCCQIMDRQDYRRCSKCKWPVCSDACEMVEHADYECKIFSENDVKFPPSTETGCYYTGIMVLRACLLRAKQPVLNLQYDFPIRVSDDNIEANRKMYEAQLTEFKVKPILSVDEWSKMMDIINVNARNLDVELLSNSKMIRMNGKYLFVQGSFFNHSCAPNCTWGISPGVNADLKIRTAVNVKKGDPLTIAYDSINYIQGTMERQREIRDRAGFVCNCDRCLDSTELNSHVSTLVCTSCNKAALTATNPLNEDAPWKCYCCDHIEHATDIVRLIDSKSKLVREKLFDSTSITYWINLISELSGNILHPNHWIINEICGNIFKFLESTVQNNPKLALNDEDRRIYLNVTEHLLGIMTHIAPGLSKSTAKLKCGISREKTTQTENDFMNGKIVHSEFNEEITKLDEMIHDAYKFFKNDTSESLDGIPNPQAVALEERIDHMKTLVLLASNEYLPVKMSKNK